MITASFQKGGRLRDKILRDQKPTNLPVEQPTRFKLMIKALGLTIPASLIVAADEVIE
jgi:putative ABC transport system substrate-binding protein